ncbi:glycosyltransferase family protein [Paenibacillus chitinolyticus]|uniref:glycosyltransferase family protein n=1 Tax=Paenibacillus chitinolyticus TaxID=79263 RepID=UPI0036500B83
MKKTIKKKSPSKQASNKWILNELKKPLNKKVQPVKSAMSVNRPDAWNELTLLRDAGSLDNPKKRPYKLMNLLLVAPGHPMPGAPNEMLLEVHLKHLVRNVTVIKHTASLAEQLTRPDLDLILILGGEEPLSDESAGALKNTPVRKVLWLSDNEKPFDLDSRTVSLFDYIFTQKMAHISVYRALQCRNCACLPYASDTDIYFPRPVKNRYKSDLLLIGHAEPESILYSFVFKDLPADEKVRVCGRGWEPFPSLIIIPPDEDLAAYYNGARIVINCSGSIVRTLEVAACGTFQLIQQHSELTPFLETGDWHTFQTQDELADKFLYYRENIDHRRLAASKALADNKYNHSSLQKGIQLLDLVFS